jgi:hypothetical protein
MKKRICKMCPNELTGRQRIFCSPTCRNKNNYQKRKVYQAEYQIRKRDELASKPSSDKCQCLICGKYYVQVGSHIVQKHGLTAREYREYFDLEVKKGILPPWYKKFKGDLALKNGTFKNLKAGEKFWFKNGDGRAGKYQRSHITLERLKVLHKFNKDNKTT